MREDYISRKAVMASLIEEYNRRKEDGGLKLAWIELAINRTPGTGWISVREKLPEDNTTVLVTTNSGHVNMSSWHASTVRTMGFDNPGVLFNPETGEMRTDGVMAWMPLPEPYKEEEA